jgi:hypothetical protein
MAKKTTEPVRWIWGWELQAWSDAMHDLKACANMVARTLEEADEDLPPTRRKFLAEALRERLNAFEQ